MHYADILRRRYKQYVLVHGISVNYNSVSLHQGQCDSWKKVAKAIEIFPYTRYRDSKGRGMNENYAP